MREELAEQQEIFLPPASPTATPNDSFRAGPVSGLTSERLLNRD